MNILLSTDNNYVMPTGVLMHSICINNPVELTFHVMVNETFLTGNRDALSVIARQYGKQICFYVITDEITKEFPIDRDDMPKHVTIACYYRLFITNVLPPDVHKIIYMDGDMIVRHSLEPLWNTDLTNLAVGVVRDQDEKRHIATQRLPYPMETGYFNSGLLVINVDYWREHDCFGQFMRFIREHGDCIKFHDQDVLNAVLYDKKKWVSTTYNFQSGFIDDAETHDYINELYEELGVTMQDPVIVHFCTRFKPWNYISDSPYTPAWRYYKSMSQWRNQELCGLKFYSFKERVVYFMKQHNLWKYKHPRLKKSPRK